MKNAHFKTLMIFLIFSAALILIVSLIPAASAQTGCCVKTKDNVACVRTEESNCNTANYTFYAGSSCTDAGITECLAGACRENNRVCSTKFKITCEENEGFFPTKKVNGLDSGYNINELDYCQKACCLFSQDSKQLFTEWKKFAGQCDIIASYLNISYTLISEASSSYSACKARSPSAEKGYCRTISECSYLSKYECDAKQGSYGTTKFFSGPSVEERKACGCESFDRLGCGEDGNAYKMNKCGELGEKNQSCGTTELCKKNDTSAYCSDIRCNIQLKYTSLGYDTEFFKKGEIKIFTPSEGDKANDIGAVKHAGDNITLDPTKSACVQYQGPGEEHYIYVCNNDGTTSVFNGSSTEGIALTSTRQSICRWNAKANSAIVVNNDYTHCGECKTDHGGIGGDVAKLLSILGADMLTADWENYWTTWPGGKPGMCDKEEDCTEKGDCVYSKNNDCVPKYAPGLNVENLICTTCLTDQASSPWSKCGDSEQCYSRGYCKYESYTYDWGTSLTICTLETIYQKGLDWAMGEGIKALGLGPQEEDAQAKADTAKDNAQKTAGQKRMDWIGRQLKYVFTLNGLLKKPYAYMKQEAKDYFAGYYGWSSSQYFDSKNELETLQEKTNPTAGDSIRINELKNDIRSTDKEIVEAHLDDVLKRESEYSSGYVANNPGNEIISISRTVVNDYDVSFIRTAGNPEDIRHLAVSAPIAASYVTTAIQNSKSSVITNIVKKEGATSSNSYGTVYYASTSAASVAINNDVKGAWDNWWKANLNLTAFVGRVADLIVGHAVNIMFKIIVDATGISKLTELIAAETAKIFGIPIAFNPMYWVKMVVCYPIHWIWGPGAAGQGACMSNPFAVPIVACAAQSAVMGGGNLHTCVPVNSWDMPGIPSGYDECYKCNSDYDPDRACTKERCLALSSNSGCIFTAPNTCSANPDSIKACDQTSATKLAISQVNEKTQVSFTESGSTRQIYNETGINFSEKEFDLKVETNKYSECRYATSRLAFANMTLIDADLSGTIHTAPLDITSNNVNDVVFTFYIQCQDTCIKTSYTDLSELRIKKNSKADTDGPVIQKTLPSADEILMGGAPPANKTDVVLSVTTDQAASCNYTEYAIAENYLAALVEYNDLAQRMVDAGATEDEIKNAFTDIIAPEIPMSGDSGELNHHVTLTLNNSNYYAYLISCVNYQGFPNADPKVIKFRVSEWYSLNIISPSGQSDNPQPEIYAITDRLATCRYGFDDISYDDMTAFTTTGRREHRAVPTRAFAVGPTFNVYVKCMDNKDNLVASNRTFSISRDTTPPVITRIYQTGGDFIVLTNEPTKCQYSSSSFSYGDEKGKDMGNNEPLSLSHSAGLFAGTLYLKCLDRADNEISTTVKSFSTERATITTQTGGIRFYPGKFYTQ